PPARAVPGRPVLRRTVPVPARAHRLQPRGEIVLAASLETTAMVVNDGHPLVRRAGRLVDVHGAGGVCGLPGDGRRPRPSRTRRLFQRWPQAAPAPAPAPAGGAPTAPASLRDFQGTAVASCLGCASLLLADECSSPACGIRDPGSVEPAHAILHGVGRQDDFADVFARLHQAMCGGRILEREGPVDNRLDDALFDERPDFPAERRGDLPFFSGAARTKRRPGDRETTTEDAAEVDWGGVPAHKANDDQTAVDRKRGEIAGNVIAADDIENQIDTVATRQLFDDID